MNTLQISRAKNKRYRKVLGECGGSSDMEVLRDAATRFSVQHQIAESAYFRAERRGFAPGHELDDWLAAEIEIADRIGVRQ